MDTLNNPSFRAFLKMGSTFSSVVYVYTHDPTCMYWVIVDHMGTQVLQSTTTYVRVVDQCLHTWSMLQSDDLVHKIQQSTDDIMNDARPTTYMLTLLEKLYAGRVYHRAFGFVFASMCDFLTHVCNMSVFSKPVVATIVPDASVLHLKTESDLGSIEHNYTIQPTTTRSTSPPIVISIRGIRTIVHILETNGNKKTSCHMSSLGLSIFIDPSTSFMLLAQPPIR